ncbi:hypothetical protein LTR28_003824, partial [Elasticomyces elasticus]
SSLHRGTHGQPTPKPSPYVANQQHQQSPTQLPPYRHPLPHRSVPIGETVRLDVPNAMPDYAATVAKYQRGRERVFDEAKDELDKVKQAAFERGSHSLGLSSVWEGAWAKLGAELARKC